jgi:hypothetical protein
LFDYHRQGFAAKIIFKRSSVYCEISGASQ